MNFVSNVHSCGPSDFALTGISFIHSPHRPLLQNQQISDILSEKEQSSITSLDFLDISNFR